MLHLKRNPIQKGDLLPDFAGVIAAPLQEVVDVVVVCLQGLVLALGAHSEDGHVVHSLRQLGYCLALRCNTLRIIKKMKGRELQVMIRVTFIELSVSRVD